MKKFTILLYLFISCSLFGQQQTHYLPHYTMKDHWETSVTLINPGSMDLPVTVQVYASSGSLLLEKVINLDPGNAINHNLRDLFPELTEESGWLSLSSESRNLRGIMTFRNKVTNGMSSLPLVSERGPNLILPLLENNDARQSGFAVVNTTDSLAELTLTLRGISDESVRVETLVLEPGAKRVAMLKNLFGDVLPEKSRLHIDGNVELTGFGLTFQNGISQIIAIPCALWEPGNLSQLEQNLTAGFAEIGLAGATGGIHHDGQDPVIAAVGLADMERNLPMKPDTPADIGSITKSYTAAVLLLLQEDGLLDLDDTIEPWFPQVADADQITIRMLLNHTSGIYDYGSSDEWHEVVLNSFGELRIFTPEELVAIAMEQGPDFAPGTGWNYSNTNYIMAGMIIEERTGKAYHQVLRERLFEPLNLCNTWLAGFEEIPGRAQRYLFLEEGEIYPLLGQVHESISWAAGSIVATSEDMLKWFRALFGGDLLSPESLQEMLTPGASDVQYGLGVGIGEINGHRVYTHNGATLGGQAFLAHFPDDDLTIGAILNHRNWSDLSAVLPVNLAVMGTTHILDNPTGKTGSSARDSSLLFQFIKTNP